MKTKIYFFTGTGNSLKVAKEISNEIDNCELIPMAALTEKDVIKPNVEKVGFIFPLYFYGLPKIVQNFIEKTELSNSSYIFSVTTAMYGDGLAIKQVEDLLKIKNKKLNSAFYINMPTNYIISMNPPSKKKQSTIFKKAEGKVKKIIDFINNSIDKKDRETFLYNAITSSKKSYKNWSENSNSNNSKFWIKEDRCNSCKICVKVCPVNDIEINEIFPIWKDDNKCQQCLSCINKCPSMAIQFGGETLKRERYSNPEISLKELINQKNS